MRWRQATRWARRSCSFTGSRKFWRSWMAQFADPQLRERFRLVALDLRGHGESQGAFGAIDQEGNPLAALAVAQYNDGNVETTSRPKGVFDQLCHTF